MKDRVGCVESDEPFLGFWVFGFWVAQIVDGAEYGNEKRSFAALRLLGGAKLGWR